MQHIREKYCLPASVLNEWTERLQGKVGIALNLVANQIWHGGDVVAETAAHFDPDWFAGTVSAPYRTHQHQQQNPKHIFTA